MDDYNQTSWEFRICKTVALSYLTWFMNTDTATPTWAPLTLVCSFLTSYGFLMQRWSPWRPSCWIILHTTETWVYGDSPQGHAISEACVTVRACVCMMILRRSKAVPPWSQMNSTRRHHGLCTLMCVFILGCWHVEGRTAFLRGHPALVPTAGSWWCQGCGL